MDLLEESILSIHHDGHIVSSGYPRCHHFDWALFPEVSFRSAFGLSFYIYLALGLADRHKGRLWTEDGILIIFFPGHGKLPAAPSCLSGDSSLGFSCLNSITDTCQLGKASRRPAGDL
jgi:hypothetical protein